jgi:dolichol-phosphate mannosyltransferase
MIIVLLPAYNEEQSLEILLPKIAEAMEGQDYRVVTCNDGSGDRTRQVLEEWKPRMPLDVLHHKINRGLGETARDLMEHAAEISAEGDVIVRMDCDDTHGPEFILDMAARLKDGYDVVIASRFAPGGGQEGVDGYRAFISRCANIFMKTLFPIRGLREYSCGFRAYDARLIKRAIDYYGNNFIQLKGLGFTCTLEKLLKLKLLGARFGEEPFVLRYDRKVGVSKMVTSITTLGYLVMTVMYYWPLGGWVWQYRDAKKAS